MDSGFSRPFLWAFELFFRPWMRARLRDPRICGLPRDLPNDVPLLVVANHVTWWDGFLVRELQRILRPDAAVYVIMAEEEFRRYPFLRFMGAVPMRRGSPGSVLRAFRTLRRHCLDHPNTIIGFFPQGRMWPSFKRPLGFERGVTTLTRVLAPVLVLPVGIHLEPLNSASPTVFLSAGSPILVPDGAASHLRVEGAVEAEVDKILAFLARNGEDASRRWPGRYGELPPRPGLPSAEDVTPPRLEVLSVADISRRRDAR